MRFDTPFFGANLFIPMAIAGLLAAVVGAIAIKLLYLPWIVAVFAIALSFALVFGIYLWLDGPRK